LFFSKSSASNIHLACFSRSPYSSHLERLLVESLEANDVRLPCVSGRWAREPRNYAERSRRCRIRENYHFLEVRNSHEPHTCARFFERFLRTVTRTRRLCQRRCDEGTKQINLQEFRYCRQTCSVALKDSTINERYIVY